jgi:hypothetical protein
VKNSQVNTSRLKNNKLLILQENHERIIRTLSKFHYRFHMYLGNTPKYTNDKRQGQIRRYDEGAS